MALTQVQQGMVGTQTSIPTTYGSIGSGDSSIMKNRIINGEFKVSQYNGTSSSTPAGDGYFIDRFRTVFTGSTKFTIGQNLNSVTPPVGFINYAGLQVATAGSLGATDYNTIQQNIEGVNVSDLAWGTANAKTVTLSFQVYSNITGTFGGALQNSSNNRSYPFSYSIPTANTWTTVSITIAGDTSGTWLTTTGVGIRVFWSMGTGTTYSGTAGAWAGSFLTSVTGATTIMASTSNVFYITGVQLEVGSSATGFEYENYTSLLQKCQRYYQRIGSTGVSGGAVASGVSYNTALAIAYAKFTTTMRAAPTGSVTSAANFNVVQSGSAYFATIVTVYTYGTDSTRVDFTSSPLVQGSGAVILCNSTTDAIQLSAEL
jgi:hypothetical protein